ncbi:fimbrial protein [Lelliottia amnigena]|uniref:Fimbrial protein n=1 Tax=Lelliottia amnigena TaxID=61646 RepID=A0ABU7UH35_LELAM
MRTKILSAAFSTLLLAGAAHAEDTSATVDINGTVTSDSTGTCGLTLNQNLVSLSENIKNVINQGDKNYNGDGPNVYFYFSGGDECFKLAGEGRLVYRFSGTADDADGTAIANTDSSEAGAKGLGIGIYDKDHNVIALNKGTLTATSTGIDMINFTMVKLAGHEAFAGKVRGTLTISIESL